MADLTQLITDVSSDADRLVSAKFLVAQDYAETAWTAANAALVNLSTLIVHPNIDTSIDVSFDYPGGTIVSGMLGDRPEAPDIANINVPSLPVLGAIRALPVFDSVVTDLRVGIVTKLEALIENGATGLGAEVEELIWDRMRGRQELENIKLYTEAEQYFSSRGFVLPFGALAARLSEIGIEITRNNSNLNNDITVEQARLAQTNSQWVIEKGIAFVLEDMKMVLTAITESNKNVIDVFAADVEKYKQDIAGQIAVVDAKVKKYSAEADIYKAGAYVASVDIDAQAKNAELQLKKADAIATLNIKKAEIELDAALKLFQLQVEAIKAAGQVASQMAASALSSVNATASLGFSGNVGLSSGYSATADLTKTTEEGLRKTETHTYSHDTGG
jgi:hypothetical protein